VELGALIEPEVREPSRNLATVAGTLIGEQLHVDRFPSRSRKRPVCSDHCSEKLSSTCATVFMPTITTERPSLSTRSGAPTAPRHASLPAASFTVRHAASCARRGRGMRARMSPFPHCAVPPVLTRRAGRWRAARARSHRVGGAGDGEEASSASRRTMLYNDLDRIRSRHSTAASPLRAGCTDTP